MSAENVEVVRRVYDAFGDPAVEAELLDPGHVLDARMVGYPGFDADVYTGIEETRRFWSDWLEAWEDIQFEVERYFDAGDCVVTLVNQRNLGRESGIWVEQPPWAGRHEVRDGRVTLTRLYPDRALALRDAGIDPAAAGE